MAQFFVILAVVVGVAILITWFNTENDKTKREAARQAKGARREKKKAFLADQAADWPHVSGMSDDLDFMMMSSDSSKLRFVRIRAPGAGVALDHDMTVSIDHVVNVELKQDTQTVTSVDVRTTTKKKGSLTRAAVGGLAFGGAGAIVGATSAGSSSHSTGSHITETKIVGNKIVIGTADPTQPTITRKFSSSSEAVNWYHRILGALSVHAA